MHPCSIVEIITPKKFILNGLWFGSRKPKRAIILVHGMFSSAFSMRHIVDRLVDNDTAVITFNNHGFELVTGARQRIGRKMKWILAGTAHESFTECVDDIQGTVNFVRKAGVRDITLVGHSTGSQKVVYWVYKKRVPRIRGLILLAPLSDYADVQKNKKYLNALRLARSLFRKGRKHELLPSGSWRHSIDAQRFLSLYTPDSIEQSIFPYFDLKCRARIFGSVRIPILAIFAGGDEHADRPARKIAEWFEKHLKKGRVVIVPRVKHSFRGGEKVVASAIHRFIAKMQ